MRYSLTIIAEWEGNSIEVAGGTKKKLAMAWEI